MKKTESKKSNLWWWDNHISPKNSKWLTENLEEVDQSVKQMLKLIEDDGDSFARKDEMYYQKRPELITHVEEFFRMYRSLAERYDHLTGELRKSISSGLQLQGSDTSEPGSGPASPFLTPDQKLAANKPAHQVVGLDTPLSSGGGSSDLSLQEGTESSSSLSSDSESESFNSSLNNYSSPPVNGDGKGHQKIIDLETELPNMKEKLQVANEENVDSMLKVGENGNYEELLGRITEYEKELRVVNQKLQFSEEEVDRLKCEVERNGSLAGNLQVRLESAERDTKTREADLEWEKRRALQLQKQLTEMDTQVSDSNQKIRMLIEELEVNRENLNGSEEEIAKLKHKLKNESSEGKQLQGQLELARKDIAMLEAELDSQRRQASELQERIATCITDVSDRDHEARELNIALRDAQNNFCLERVQLQSEISSLSEQNILLEERLKEWELRNKSLEEEIRKCEAETMNMKELHEAQEIGLQGVIEILKAQHAERGEVVEGLNKKLDMHKLKYDMLMAEKENLNAKVQTLIAEGNSQDIMMRQLEEHVKQLHIKQVELIEESDSKQMVVNELRLRVEELETEMEKQRVVILEGAEQKREAIRQLCFSLEHYRSGYQELRQAFRGHKRVAVLAA